MTNWREKVLQAVSNFFKSIGVIRKDGPSDKPYCVYSKKTGRNFGCYKTKKEAEKRLSQIEMFKHINES